MGKLTFVCVDGAAVMPDLVPLDGEHFKMPGINREYRYVTVVDGFMLAAKSMDTIETEGLVIAIGAEIGGEKVSRETIAAIVEAEVKQ